MSAVVQTLQVYEDLADWYDQQGQAKLRDWFLVLAADTAMSLGEKDRAERFRKRLLHVNPHHLLKPFASFADAMKTQDVKRYITDLRRRYPLETAEHLLKASQKQRGQAPSSKKPEIKVIQTKKQATVAAPVATSLQPKTAMPKKSEPKRNASAPEFQLALTWKRPRGEKLKSPDRSADTEQSQMDRANESEKDELSVWISTVLIVVTIVAGLGLTLLTLASPIFTG